jgi:sigma-E factor negative regulatory protein RseC
MIESQARVVQVEGEVAYVAAEREAGCSSCSASGGCGVTALGKMFGVKPKLFQALNPIGALTGEQVVIGLEEGALLKGSIAVYLVPLLLLVGGAGVASYLGTDAGTRDGYAVLGAGVGLLLGMVWLKLFSGAVGVSRRFQPVILRRLRTFNLVQET